MKKMYLLPIVCVLMLAIASIPNALCYPPAGTDHLDPTTATIELEITGYFTEVIVVTGPTDVSRSDQYDPGDGHIKIDTEIISMNLAGTSAHIGPITITESLTKASTGAIQQQHAGIYYPAESFFDVFIEIRGIAIIGSFHNDDPALMSTTIYSIPPWEAIYISPPIPIPLKNEQEEIIGFILHVAHEIPPAPPVGGIVVPMDKLGLLVPYMGIASTVLLATTATVIYVKHTKNKKKQ